MVTLTRGREALTLPNLFWDAAQVFAKQAGWRSAGAHGVAGRAAPDRYTAGRLVSAPDATGFAKALEAVVNGEKGDSGELDLAQLVGLVNFLRGGAFEIR
jgi:hypothetical protein